MDNPQITYYESGNIKRKFWRENGQYHRPNGPSYISYYENGNKKNEYWHKNDQLHRFDGPAIIYYYDTGNIGSEEWYIYEEEISPPYKDYPLTKEQIIEMKLTYG